MKQSLEKTISIAELQRLRAERGLSNAEIAEMLDISLATVYKYLGPQKARKKQATGGACPAAPVTPPPAPVHVVRVYMPDGYVDFQGVTPFVRGTDYELRNPRTDSVVAVFSREQIYGVALLDYVKEG